MYEGFPIALIPLLRCLDDEGALTTPLSQRDAIADFIPNGVLNCATCPREYRIIDGILRLYEDCRPADPATEHERVLWEAEAETYESEITQARKTANAMEIPATLRALGPCHGRTLLELACGTGRYTTHLVTAGCTILAVDLSLPSLHILAAKLPPSAQIGLVHADITRLAVAPERFDLVLGAHVLSSLPSREHRLAMHRVASQALMDRGRFVFSGHYYGVRERLAGASLVSRYEGDGMYRWFARRDEVRREAGPYFRRLHVRQSEVFLPLAQRLGLPVVQISRVAEHMPLVNEFGRLLLATAEQPIGLPAEGPPGYRFPPIRELLRRYRPKRARRSPTR